MKTVLILAVLCFFPYLARADTEIFPANCSVPVPDITGWEITRQSRIEFRLSDQTVAYLGLDIERSTYRNPDSGEFMQVIRRHTPATFAQPKQENDRLLGEMVEVFYAEKDMKDLLDALEKKTDSFLYVYWRIRTNPRNGNDVLDGDVNIWFMPPGGECRFVQNEPIGVQFMTEHIGNGKPRNVFVGVKYQVGDVYHILKVDRRDVANLMEREK